MKPNPAFKETLKLADSDNRVDSGVDARRLVKHRGGKWLWAWSLEADQWNGCWATLEEAIADAMKSRQWDGVEADAPCYFSHGYKIPKAECDEWGLDWPWYQVECKTALRIFMPNN